MLSHLLAAPAPSGTAPAAAATIFSILAAAVIVLGGLAALVRAIWKTATILRDNTAATRSLTGRMDELASSVDGRFDRLLHRVEQLEQHQAQTGGQT